MDNKITLKLITTNWKHHIRIKGKKEMHGPLAILLSLPSLKSHRFGTVQEPKFYIFLELYTFAVEKVVKLVTESSPFVDRRLNTVTSTSANHIT
jgi:hypothetical protein